MNNKLVIILLCVILTTVVIFGGITISSLNYRIDELNAKIDYGISSVSGNIYGIESSIGSITYNIETAMSKQASIISGYSVSYGKPDADTLKGEVTVSVIPKEYSDATSAVLYVNGNAFDMARSGNAFTGTAAVKINELSKTSVTFSQNGVNKSEPLPEEISFGYLLKQSLQIDYSPDAYSHDGQNYGNVSYSFHSELGDRALSAKIVAKYNGQERWSQNIPDPGSSEVQQFQFPIGQELKDNNSFGDIYEEYEVYIEVTGSLGFTYRYWLGGYYEAIPEGSYEVRVYDRSGNEVVF